jgi:hypothetical protein
LVPQGQTLRQTVQPLSGSPQSAQARRWHCRGFGFAYREDYLMPIIIRETYEIITPESAENGEAADSGFIDETGTAYSFRELCYKLRGMEASSSHPVSRFDWATSYGEQDWRTGGYENRGFHPVSDRDARWFWKAYAVANRR